VQNRRDPVRVRKRPALIVGDGDERSLGKSADDVRQARRSSRPCMVVRNGTPVRPRTGSGSQSTWEWITSKSPARSAMASISSAQAAFGSAPLRPRRNARGQTAWSFPFVFESPLANRVTSCEFDQPGDHPLRATIKLWRNALGQRGKLRDPHRSGTADKPQAGRNDCGDEKRNREQRPTGPCGSTGYARDEHFHGRQHSSWGSRSR
jgi:hypothetical protein